MNKNFSRAIDIDIIRILAILAVIMIHVAAPYVTNFDEKSIYFITGNIFDSISRIGVPFFILISGTLMLDSEKTLPVKKIAKKVLKLTMILIIWSAFYALIYNFHNFKCAFLYGHYHLWYAYFVIGLYLITPVLRLFVKKENINFVYYFVLLALVFSYLPNTLDGLFSHSNSISKFANLFSMNFVTGLTAYYLAGYLIKYDFEKLQKYKWIFLFSSIISLISIILFTQFRTNQDFQAYNYFYKNSNILVFAYSVSLFITFKIYLNKKIQKLSNNIKNIIEKISSLTFGVYLVHACLLHLLTSIVKHLIIPSPVLEILILYTGTTVLSFLIIFIVSKIKYLNQLIKI